MPTAADELDWLLQLCVNQWDRKGPLQTVAPFSSIHADELWKQSTHPLQEKLWFETHTHTTTTTKTVPPPPTNSTTPFEKKATLKLGPWTRRDHKFSLMPYPCVWKTTYDTTENHQGDLVPNMCWHNLHSCSRRCLRLESTNDCTSLKKRQGKCTGNVPAFHHYGYFFTWLDRLSILMHKLGTG